MEIETIRARCGKVRHLDPPPDVVKWLNEFGGMNRFGDPNYRLVWSGNATTYRTKLWHDKDENGNVVRRVFECRECLKYTHPTVAERFILESWRDPRDIEFGDRELWRRKNTKYENGRLIVPLGDFPSRGDYQLCGVVLGLDGESFDWPAPAYLWADIEKHKYVKRSITPLQAERMAEANQQAEEQAEEDAIYDRIRDNMVFNRNKFVTLSNRSAYRP